MQLATLQGQTSVSFQPLSHPVHYRSGCISCRDDLANAVACSGSSAHSYSVSAEDVDWTHWSLISACTEDGSW